MFDTEKSFRLVPMGSFSRIEKISDKSSYELYGSGDLHLGRLLHNRRFDYAMVAFLDCLRQVIEYVKSQDPSADFPHPYVSLFLCCDCENKILTWLGE